MLFEYTQLDIFISYIFYFVLYS